MRRVWLTAALVTLGFGLFAGILVLVGPADVWRQIQALGPLGFLTMLGNELLGALFWIASWGILLMSFGGRPPFLSIAGTSLAGFAVSYVTPVAYVGGEPVRAALMSRRASLPLVTVYATLLVDRLLAGLCLVTFAVLGGAITLSGPLLPRTAKIQVGVSLVIVSAAVALGVWSFARNLHWLSRIIAFPGRIRPRWHRPAAWSSKVREVENGVYEAFRRFLPWTALALGLQALSFLCVYARPQLFFHFTEARHFALTDLAIYFNLNAILTTALWLTPAGVGVAEGGRMGIFALLEIPGNSAVAFSLTIRFLELLLVMAGALYLLRSGLLGVAARQTPSGSSAPRVQALFGRVRGVLEVGVLYVWAPLRQRWRQRAFERRFRVPDPWSYERSPYERRKYEQKLAALPRRPNPSAPPYKRVLELGCAEGWFTRQLSSAGVGEELVGVDFARLALERARAACSDPRVRFLEMDITTELPSGTFDLVILSEVLYYLGSLSRIEALAAKLGPHVAPGGHILLVGPWPAARLFHRAFLSRAETYVVSDHVERNASRPYVITCLEQRPQ